MKRKIYASIVLAAMFINVFPFGALASSHREAPLIANDPLADNTDLYAFRSPDDPNKVTIIACYVPGQLPQGGPNYYSFGQNIRYEIHVDNNIATNGDDITYRFTFDQMNEDPTTFFNIRLGKQNLKTTYKLERSMDGGKNFATIVNNGTVPPPNIGPRSINSPVGLNAPNYDALIQSAIKTASTGEKVFCGTSDDPFFVDLGGIFDLGDAPRTTGTQSIDGLKCLNVSTIALQVDISTLQKDHKPVSMASNILDPNYVIGVWASASRQKISVLKDYKDYENNNNGNGNSGPWIQVSRLGMPLTNEVIVPVGMKDYWNSLTPYQDLARLNVFGNHFYNPELGLYMDDALFGTAVPALSPLRIQKNSLACAFGGTGFGFGNGQNGLYGLKGNPALAGSALDDAIFGNLLLPAANSPRSVDLWPIFNTGVPNLKPYQLATGKGGNPLATGKPFINNFLPNGGDMLRLNMAVPPTPRNDPKFSNLGLVQAAVLGLTDPAYNANASLQNIPNMDGFPNGRRLEDDVVRIELQAVSGIVLAAIGLWYDDYNCAGSPVTPDLLDVYTYNAGVTSNDAALKPAFPYVATPWSGTHNCDCNDGQSNKTQANMGKMPVAKKPTSELGLASPEMNLMAYPNPSDGSSKIKYSVDATAQVKIVVYDMQGNKVDVLADEKQEAGVHTVEWDNSSLAKGTYIVTALKNGTVKQVIKVIKN
ncbi:MAG TPA: DUF4331 family protein [Chitinophagaceae bacterium]|nr:DUF4331 family protein [Chitinophagaceae bacterium]